MALPLKRLIQIILCFFLVIILDIIWFSLVGNIYDAAFEPMRAEFNTELTSSFLGASVLIYLFVALLITFFVFPQLDEKTDYTMTFLLGGFLGMLVFGIYDLTNYILFVQWPLRIAVMDICWGFLVFGLTALIVRAISSFFKK
jgi:uncharacterized membrane protein